MDGGTRTGPSGLTEPVVGSGLTVVGRNRSGESPELVRRRRAGLLRAPASRVHERSPLARGADPAGSALPVHPCRTAPGSAQVISAGHILLRPLPLMILDPLRARLSRDAEGCERQT